MMRAPLSHQARNALRRARRHFAPPERLTIGQWARKYRKLHSGPYAGNLFDIDITPALAGLFDAYHDPNVGELWCAKSSQLGWTQGLLLNVIGYHVHLDPCPILVLTAREPDARRFSRTKLVPAIKASAPLKKRVPLGLGKGSSWDYKHFLGGWIQLAGANAPGNIKSTEYRVVLVEEPDDTNSNVKGQGDAIALGRERKKAYTNGKLIVGGTPTVKGLSRLWEGLERTDKRRMYLECSHCGHEQYLRWDQMRWDEDAPVDHPVYGTARPETARYACEACGIDEAPELHWTDEQKNVALRAAAKRPDKGWRATAPFNGSAGFYLNELYSTFSESRFSELVKKYLEALHAESRGDDTLMRAFKNNQLGEPYELKGDNPEVDALVERGEAYALWTAPAGALIVTCFVDVQRGGENGDPRLEYLIVGWGRDLESWRIAKGVIVGNPLEEAAWAALDSELATPISSLGGGTLPIRLMAVDSGDGMTQEAVYRYVRAKRREGRDVVATKGSSKRDKPLFSLPRKLDHQNGDRASKYGLKLYLIGTDAAKDTIYGRLKLEGNGPARMHWPKAIGSDYLNQLTSEVKIPDHNGKEKYVVLAGRRNEMLDCEVGNLWCAHKLRLNTLPATWWDEQALELRQPSLLESQPQAAARTNGVPAGAGAKPVTASGARPFTGFGAGAR